MRKFLWQLIIEKLGKKYGYDASYLLYILEHTPGAMGAFGKVTSLANYRTSVPPHAHEAAKIVGVMVEGCGPCVQLCVDMARRAGMPDEQVEAVLVGELSGMDSNTSLAYRFAVALCAGTLETGQLREEVLSTWGNAGVIELTLACQISRIYPMIKTGLGFAGSCARIAIGERHITVDQSVPIARKTGAK